VKAGLIGTAGSLLLSAWPSGMIGAALRSDWVLPNCGWRGLGTVEGPV